jgi:hypothetical protein
MFKVFVLTVLPPLRDEILQAPHVHLFQLETSDKLIELWTDDARGLPGGTDESLIEASEKVCDTESRKSPATTWLRRKTG